VQPQPPVGEDATRSTTLQIAATVILTAQQIAAVITHSTVSVSPNTFISIIHKKKNTNFTYKRVAVLKAKYQTMWHLQTNGASHFPRLLYLWKYV